METLKKLLALLRFLSKILSRIITMIVLTLIYFFGIGPLAILGKLCGKDFIGEKRKQTNSYWIEPKHLEPTLENFKKPY